MTTVRHIRLCEVKSGASVAAGRYDRQPGLLVVLEAPDGTLGIGEASPLSGYSPDAFETTRRALSGLVPRALNAAIEARKDASLVERLRALSNLLDDGLPAARFALETALVDLECRQKKRSPSSLLGCESGASVSVAALIPVLAPESLELARRRIEEGYETLKVKIDGRAAREPGLLDELARLPARLRVDANRSLSAEQLRQLAPELVRLGVEFIEEPCTTFSAAEIGAPSPRLALDESLKGVAPQGLEALLERSGARVVVLKPMVLGGFVRCFELARIARQRGVAVVVSHTFDGPVALHAACLLALCVQSRELAAGLAPHAALAQWPATPIPLARPGLLDPAVFDRAWLAPEQVLTPRPAPVRP